MTALRRRSKHKNNQRKRKASKTLTIQELRLKLFESKEVIINEQSNDDNDEETIYTVQSMIQMTI